MLSIDICNFLYFFSFKNILMYYASWGYGPGNWGTLAVSGNQWLWVGYLANLVVVRIKTTFHRKSTKLIVNKFLRSTLHFLISCLSTCFHFCHTFLFCDTCHCWFLCFISDSLAYLVVFLLVLFSFFFIFFCHILLSNFISDSSPYT